MQENVGAVNTVEEYIALFPQDIQEKLRDLRALIREVAPEAQEKISYRMPGYSYKGPLVYFAAFKHHIGLYPAGWELREFKDELAPYKQTKGSVHFPLDQALPYDLIRRIVAHRLEQNRKKSY